MKHIGSLVVTAENYPQFAIVEEITGDLTIGQIHDDVIELAKLVRVGGTLRIDQPVDLPLVASIGGSLVVAADAGVLAPALNRVGGDAELGGQSVLPGLVSVVGDVKIFDASKPPFQDEDDLDDIPWDEIKHSLPSLAVVAGTVLIYAEVELPSLIHVAGLLHMERRQQRNRNDIYARPMPPKAWVPRLTCVARSLTTMDNAQLHAPSLSLIGEDASVRADLYLPALLQINGGLSVLRETQVDLPLLTAVDGHVEIQSDTTLPSLARVQGDLRVLSNTARLPALKEITGDVEIRYGAELPGLTRIGGNFSVCRSIAVPALAYVGGYISEIGSTGLRRPSWAEAFQAPKLACAAAHPYPNEHVQGHMGHLRIDADNVEECAALVEVTGDLTIDAEITMSFLTRIGGTLRIVAHTRLPSLLTVGGSVLVEPNLHAHMPELLHIGRAFRLTSYTLAFDTVETPVVPYLPRLSTIGGDLELESSCPLPALSEIGGTADVSTAELPMLYKVRRLHVRGEAMCPMLVRVDDDVTIYGTAELPRLMFVGGFLEVHGVTKLPMLVELGGSMNIRAASWFPMLSQIGGGADLHSFVSMPLLARIKGDLVVYETTKLPALAEIGGRLVVYGPGTALLPNLAFVRGEPYDDCKALSS